VIGRPAHGRGEPHPAAEPPHGASPPPSAPPPQTEVAAPAPPPKKTHSAALTLGQAIWEYAWEARWVVFFASLFFFLTAQASRQVADYFIRWWTR
jgi:hypothetical protein